MRRRALLLFVAALGASGCLPEDDTMALPTSRDVTFAPGSQVPSATLNDIQDQIIANNTRLAGGAGSAVSLALDITAPAYHFTAPLPLMIPAASGGPGHSGDGNWSTASGYAIGSDSAGDWVVGIPVTYGETIEIEADWATTVTGGFVTLTAVDPTTAAVTVVGSWTIAATGIQIHTIVTGHVVLVRQFYQLQFNPTTGVGTGPKTLFGVRKNWVR